MTVIKGINVIFTLLVPFGLVQVINACCSWLPQHLFSVNGFLKNSIVFYRKCMLAIPQRQNLLVYHQSLSLLLNLPAFLISLAHDLCQSQVQGHIPVQCQRSVLSGDIQIPHGPSQSKKSSEPKVCHCLPQQLSRIRKQRTMQSRTQCQCPVQGQRPWHQMNLRRFQRDPQSP